MSYENQICELYFLLHRNNIHEIGSRLTLLLRSLKTDSNMCYLKTLYLLIGHVRDIYFGHGERDISYIMIYVWYKFYPVLAIYAFHQFVLGDCPYGCWNDIKYFCKFISRISDKGIHDPLIDIAVSCANNQLLLDMSMEHSFGVSNLCKWIPRENKVKWLFDKLVIDWFSRFDIYNNLVISDQKKLYRQMIVSNCKRVFTIKNIFQSISNGSFKDVAYDHSNGGRSYFYDNVFIGTYIKSAIDIISSFSNVDFDTYSEAIWLNKKWCQMVSAFFDNTCYGGIPVVDISADISNESLYHSIGFACLIAIKSRLFRILLVSNTPIWIEFTNSDSICAIVHKIWSFCTCRSGSQFSVSFHFLMDGFCKYTSSMPFGMNLTLSLNNNSCILNDMKEHSIHSLNNYEKSSDFIGKTSPDGTFTSKGLKLFLFSNRFLFDWSLLSVYFENKCSFVFWNVGVDGESFIFDKTDFHIDDHKEILFVSGCNVSLFSKFCSHNIDKSNGLDFVSVSGSYMFLLESLYSDRYKGLSTYFDSQTSSSCIG